MTNRKQLASTIYVLSILLGIFAFGGPLGCDDSTPSSGSDGDTDGDTDGDSDGDSDGDTDGDTDGDSDGDSDGSEGCGEDPSGIGMTLEVNGQTRNFELYIPSDYDSSKAYPLIFGLHGGGGTGAGFRSYCGLDEEVGSDAVVVYPDGLPEGGFGDNVWILDPEGDDFVFFDDLLAHLKTNLCIDETRVFSTGWSMGGYMTNGVGCYRADVFRAIASCSGGTPGPKPPEEPYADCEGEIPAMVIHGTSDSVIPLSEGETIRDTFIENNGCDDTSSPTDPSPCVSYDGCDTPLHWCEFAGDHEWPDFVPGGVWQFFSSQ